MPGAIRTRDDRNTVAFLYEKIRDNDVKEFTLWPRIIIWFGTDQEVCGENATSDQREIGLLINTIKLRVAVAVGIVVVAVV